MLDEARLTCRQPLSCDTVLDQFARQNVAEIDEIPLETEVINVQLPGAEMAYAFRALTLREIMLTMLSLASTESWNTTSTTSTRRCELSVSDTIFLLFGSDSECVLAEPKSRGSSQRKQAIGTSSVPIDMHPQS